MIAAKFGMWSALPTMIRRFLLAYLSIALGISAHLFNVVSNEHRNNHIVILAYCVKGNRVKSITQAIVTLHPVSLSLNALAAAADLTIAFTMTLILHSMRSGFSPTNNALVTLMVRRPHTYVMAAEKRVRLS